MVNIEGKSTLEVLVKSLGELETYGFLEASLSVITNRKKTLCLLLESKDYEAAAKCEESTIGSVRFFGSGSLETLLLETSKGQFTPSSIADLQHKLTREFEDVIHEIKAWLVEHKP